MTHVPYRGAGPAMNDLIPGRVDAMFSNLPGVLPQVQSGTIRGLAVTTAKRSPAAPDIPAIGETLPGYCLFVRAKTPDEIIIKIHADAVTAPTHSIDERAVRSDRRPGHSVHPDRTCPGCLRSRRRVGPHH
jgi:tripartite-type tricarboxylate transporter receptor subunit TctC